jgi:hypothetical protein
MTESEAATVLELMDELGLLPDVGCGCVYARIVMAQEWSNALGSITATETLAALGAIDSFSRVGSLIPFAPGDLLAMVATMRADTRPC